MRTCKMCGQTLPLDRFPNTYGYKLYTCKECQSIRVKQWKANRMERERSENSNFRSNNSRRCTGCGIVKMLSDFERDSLHCRACHRARRESAIETYVRR